MVLFPKVEGGSNQRDVLSAIFARNSKGKIRFNPTSVYTKIYTTLREGGVVMMKIDKNADGTKVPSYDVGNIGTMEAVKHLQSFKELEETIENGIIYFKKVKFDTNEESTAIAKNKTHNKKGNCKK